MKKDNQEFTDELRPEYDLKSLKVRRLGPGRKRLEVILILNLLWLRRWQPIGI
jgi:hypothetical protein